MGEALQVLIVTANEILHIGLMLVGYSGAGSRFDNVRKEALFEAVRSRM
jgi:hypothetical protein